MGLFPRWKEQKREQFRKAAAPYDAARNEIWNREIAALGEKEFHRRLNAVSAHQIGQTGPSGFEDWQWRLDLEIMQRAFELGRLEDQARR